MSLCLVGITSGEKVFSLPKFLLHWLADSAIAWFGWNRPLHLYDFLPVGNLCFHLSWSFWVLHPSNWNHFSTRKFCKPVFTFANVHMVCASYLFHGNSNVVSHEWSSQNAGSWKKWFIFLKRSWKKVLQLHFVFYLRFFFGLCYLMIPYKIIVHWSFHKWRFFSFLDNVTWYFLF